MNIAKKNIFAINKKISNFVTMCIDNPSIDFHQKVNLAKNVRYEGLHGHWRYAWYLTKFWSELTLTQSSDGNPNPNLNHNLNSNPNPNHMFDAVEESTSDAVNRVTDLTIVLLHYYAPTCKCLLFIYLFICIRPRRSIAINNRNKTTATMDENTVKLLK